MKHLVPMAAVLACTLAACQPDQATNPVHKTVVPPQSPALTSSIDPGVTFQFSAPGTLDRANAVNDAGLVVGDYSPNNVAAVWSPASGTIVLGNTDGSTTCCSTFSAVNRSGLATGASATGGEIVVMTWQQGATSESNLGVLPGGQDTRGVAIDDAGNIAGHDDASAGTPYFKPSGGAMIPLAKGSYLGVYVTAMNNGGMITGVGTTTDLKNRATEWSHYDAALTDLPMLGGDNSFASAINSAGDVVGWSEVMPGDRTRHAMLWSANGTTVDLSSWPGSCHGTSDASAVSDAGVIAGRCNGLPVIWTAMQGMRALPLPSGALTGEPHGMNNLLQIVGTHDGYGGAMWTVSNHAPVAVAGGPYFGSTAAHITLSGTASSDPDGDAITYAWDFGDGSTATNAHPSHRYDVAGAYIVHLIVTDSHGASATTTTTASIETQVPLITAGEKYSCAVSLTGNALCWGQSPYGGSNVPTNIAFTQLTAGFATTCGLMTNSSVSCYGTDGTGQNLAPPGAYVEVTMGQYHACVLAGDLSVRCWGGDSFHEQDLPNGSYAQVSAGYLTTCAINVAGGVVCAGDGYPSNGGSWAPPSGVFQQVSTSDGHACAIRDTRSIVCWGDNASGRVGGSVSSGFVVFEHAGAYREVRTGPGNTCALAMDGTLSCWGYDVDGRSTPPSGNFTRLAVGASQGCAIRTDGTVACWGDNSFGQANPPTALTNPPTANAGGPYAGNQSVSIAFDGTASVGAGLSYQWTFGDGGTATGARPRHVYVNTGSYTVTLVVTNNDNVVSTPATASVVVTNTAPTAHFAASPHSVHEGSAFSLALTNPHDGGADTSSLQYAFDCGDPAHPGYSALSSSSTYSCATSDNGVRQVRGKIADANGGATEYSDSVTVTNVTPVVTIDSIQTAGLPARDTRVWFHFADPGTNDGGLPNNYWAVTLACGDGQHGTWQLTPGFVEALECTYTTAGLFTVSVSITDKDGAVGVDNKNVRIH